MRGVGTTAGYFRIDETNGAVDRISGFGLAGFYLVRGLAFDPNSGVLYGVDNGNKVLIAIDPITGKASAIGELGSLNVSDLAFDTNSNVLYGVDDRERELVAFDVSR